MTETAENVVFQSSTSNPSISSSPIPITMNVSSPPTDTPSTSFSSPPPNSGTNGNSVNNNINNDNNDNNVNLNMPSSAPLRTCEIKEHEGQHKIPTGGGGAEKMKDVDGERENNRNDQNSPLTSSSGTGTGTGTKVDMKSSIESNAMIESTMENTNSTTSPSMNATNANTINTTNTNLNVTSNTSSSTNNIDNDLNHPTDSLPGGETTTDYSTSTKTSTPISSAVNGNSVSLHPPNNNSNNNPSVNISHDTFVPETTVLTSVTSTSVSASAVLREDSDSMRILRETTTLTNNTEETTSTRPLVERGLITPLTPSNTMTSLVDVDRESNDNEGSTTYHEHNRPLSLSDTNNTMTTETDIDQGQSQDNVGAPGGLPLPIPLQAAQVYLKGKYTAEGYHKIKGYWATKYEDHDLNQEEAKRDLKISRFQYEMDSSEDFPANGKFDGYFDVAELKKDSKTRYVDKIDLKFIPNANTPYGYNVIGKGEAQKWGSYSVSGTFDKESGAIVLYRNYNPQQIKVNANKGRRQRQSSLNRSVSGLSQTTTSKTIATGNVNFTLPPNAHSMQEPTNAPSLLPRDSTTISTSRPERQRRAPSRIETANLDKQMQKCYLLLQQMNSDKRSLNFKTPVDTTIFKDYLNFVSQPMDLGTIKRMIEMGELTDREKFADLIRLTFENAKLYTPQDTQPIHIAAQQLLDWFELKYEAVKNQFEKRPVQTGPSGSRRTGGGSEIYGSEDMDLDEEGEEGGLLSRGMSIHNVDRFSETMSNASYKRRAADRRSVNSGDSNSKRSGRGGKTGGAKRGSGGNRKLTRTASMKSSQKGSERGSQNGESKRGGGAGRGRGSSGGGNRNNNNNNNMMNQQMEGMGMMNPMMGMGMMNPMMGMGMMNPMMMMAGGQNNEMVAEMMNQQIETMQRYQRALQQGGTSTSSTSPIEKPKGRGRGGGGQRGKAASKATVTDTDDEQNDFPAPAPRESEIDALCQPLNEDEVRSLLEDLNTKLTDETIVAEVLTIIGSEPGKEVELDVEKLEPPKARTLIKYFEKLRKIQGK